MKRRITYQPSPSRSLNRECLLVEGRLEGLHAAELRQDRLSEWAVGVKDTTLATLRSGRCKVLPEE